MKENLLSYLKNGNEIRIHHNKKQIRFFNTFYMKVNDEKEKLEQMIRHPKFLFNFVVWM